MGTRLHTCSFRALHAHPITHNGSLQACLAYLLASSSRSASHRSACRNRGGAGEHCSKVACRLAGSIYNGVFAMAQNLEMQGTSPVRWLPLVSRKVATVFTSGLSCRACSASRVPWWPLPL